MWGGAARARGSFVSAFWVGTGSRRFGVSPAPGLRGPLVVTQDAAIAACPRLGLCAGPALNRKRSPRPRSPVATRPGAHGPFGVTPPAGARDTLAWCPPESGLACGPFRGRVPRLWRQEDLCVCVLGGGGDTRPSAAGARAWQGWEVTFGALVTTGGLQGGAEGKRNTRQAPGRGGPSFLGCPFSQRQASSSWGSGSLIHTAGRECGQELCLRPGNPGPEGSEWIKPKRNALLRTGDVSLRACTESPGRRFAAHRTHSRSACVAVLAGPAPPSHPLFQRQCCVENSRALHLVAI